MDLVRGGALGGNVEQSQFVEDGLHCPIRFAEKDAAPHPCEGPSESLEHELSLHVLAELFEREIVVPITLDGQALTVTFHYQIDAPRSDLPTRDNVVAGLHQVLHDIALEAGLDGLFFVVEISREQIRCLRVLNEAPPQVGRLKVGSRVQGVDDPHLVPRPAGGYVVPLLEHLLITKIERSACGGIHNGHEKHIALVSLKLRRGSAQQAMPFVQIGSKMQSQEAIDFQSLFLAHKGHDTKTGWPSELVDLVVGVFKCRAYERSNDLGLRVVDFSIPGGAGDVIGNEVRSQPHAARISQRFNVTDVRELVAELNDFGATAKVLNQPNGLPERLASQVVD